MGLARWHGSTGVESIIEQPHGWMWQGGEAALQKLTLRLSHQMGQADVDGSLKIHIHAHGSQFRQLIEVPQPVFVG